MPNAGDRIQLPGCPHGRTPKLSIAVMVTNGLEQVERCLRSLAMVGAEVGDCQTILVLNDPTAEIRGFVEEHVECDEVIDSPANLGTAVSWQLAFNRARADRVLLLHEDAAARPGSVGMLMEAMDAHPVAACVAPLLASEEDGDEPSTAGWLVWRERLETRLRITDVPEDLLDAPYPVDVIGSAFALWDRAVWSEIGGFDERRFPAVGVDYDACLAARTLGRSALVVPTVTCDHSSGAMDTREGPLSGKPVRHFLIEDFRRFTDEKWSQTDDEHVSLRDRGLLDQPDASALKAGIENAADRHRRTTGPTDRFRMAMRPITDPNGTGESPVDVSDAIVERVTELEKSVVERYRVWLVEQHDQLSDDLRRATSEGALLFESREALTRELANSQAEVARLSAEVVRLSGEIAERDRAIAEAHDGSDEPQRGRFGRLRQRVASRP